MTNDERRNWSFLTRHLSDNKAVLRLDRRLNVDYNVGRNPHKRVEMKTIQMTIDESLLEEVDGLIATLNTTRSAFIRRALQSAIRKHIAVTREEQHEQGYAQHPVQPGEFDVWTDEQAWSEE